MNPRRLLVLALGASLSGHAPLLYAQAAAAGLRRVGVLAPSTREKEELILKPFFDEMRELAWIEGQNIAYDRVYADDQMALLPGLAADLVARRPELIFAPPTAAALAAKQATRTIPIVFGVVVDPAGIGLVTSFARPGGNITGLGSQQEESLGKAPQVLHELVPTARRIAVVVNEANPSQQALWAAARHAAAELNLQPLQVAVNAPAQLPAAAQQITMLQAPAVLFTADPMFTNVRERIQPQMQATRLPVAYSLRHQLAADGRLSFGNHLRANRHYPAKFVDAIVKGAKLADRRVEQSLKFERVINLSDARKLGLTVQRALLLRADEVLQ